MQALLWAHHLRSYKKEGRGKAQAPGRLKVAQLHPRRRARTLLHLPVLPPVPNSEASSPPTTPSRAPPQSLGAAVEQLTRTPLQLPETTNSVSKVSSKSAMPKIKLEASEKNGTPAAPVHPISSMPTKGPTVVGKEISGTVLNTGSSCAIMNPRNERSELSVHRCYAPNQPCQGSCHANTYPYRCTTLSVTAHTVKTLSARYVPHIAL
jgi:hypothetical protein